MVYTVAEQLPVEVTGLPQALINPQRMRCRVTVVILCVCVSVCLSVCLSV